MHVITPAFKTGDEHIPFPRFTEIFSSNPVPVISKLLLTDTISGVYAAKYLNPQIDSSVHTI